MEMHQRSSDEIDFEGDGGAALLRRSGLRRRLSFGLLAHPGGAAAPAKPAPRSMPSIGRSFSGTSAMSANR